MDKEIDNSIFQEEIHDLIALKRALGFSYESEAVSCGFSANISTISGFLHIFRRKGSPGKGADTMHIFTQMKNFKVFLMQLTKVSRCRIPARIVLM